MTPAEQARAVADSFRTEIAYVQGSLCTDVYDTRRRRWLSLVTVLGILNINLGLENYELDKMAGVDAHRLGDHKP